MVGLEEKVWVGWDGVWDRVMCGNVGWGRMRLRMDRGWPEWWNGMGIRNGSERNRTHRSNPMIDPMRVDMTMRTNISASHLFIPSSTA